MTKKVANIAFILFGFVLWELIVTILNVQPYIFPKPSDMLSEFFDNIDIIISNTLFTLTIAIIGLLFSIVLGLIIAIIINEVKVIRNITLNILQITQMVPIVAIAPLFAIWFGYGIMPKVTLVTFVCTFPIILNLSDSFINIDKDKLDDLTMLKTPLITKYIYLYIPNSAYVLFVSIKVAVTYAMISALFSEYMGSEKGLGLLLQKSLSSYNTSMVFLIIVIIIIITLLLNKVLDLIKNNVITWS
ncbi:MAG: ABC transporter permease [Mycoplasmatales bacterium]